MSLPLSAIPKVVALFETTLASKITSSATSGTLTSGTDKAGSSLSGVFGLTIDEGTASEEFIITTLSGGSFSGALRGIDPQDGTSEVSALKKAHRRGATVKVTTFPFLGVIYRLLQGTEGFPNILKYASAQSFTPGSNQLASVTYVDETAFNGAPDSSDTQKGLTEKATQTEVNEGDDTGSTTGPLYVSPSTHLATWDLLVSTDFTYGATIAAKDPLYIDAADSNKLKKALASGSSTADTFIGIAIEAGANTDAGKRVQIGGLVTGLSGLTAGSPVYLTDAGAFSATPGTYRVVVGLAISTTAMWMNGPVRRIMEIAGVNSAASVANLNELLTFINATDITGAEAESLTDDSTLTNKHFHKTAHTTATRAGDAASGSQTIAHGLGATPKWVRITMLDGTANGIFCSEGKFDASGTHCVYTNTGGTGTGNTDSTNVVRFNHQNGSNVATCSVDGTNVTLTWTKNSSPPSDTLLMLVDVGV